MQAKGIVRFFLVLLLLGCAWQLIYIFPANKVENDADAKAKKAAAIASAEQKEDVYKLVRANYLDSMSSTTILDLPLMGKFTYQQCKSNQLALGLDLKGGMSVVLQVNLQDFLKSLSGNSSDADFKKALDAAVASQKQTQGDFIQIFVNEFKKSGRPLASVFSRNESLKNEININTSDAKVQDVLRTKANETVNETFKRLQQRIDKLGVVQPNVSLDKSRDMIMVELPGIDNPARARAFLQAAAKLEFWEVYRTSDAAVMNALSEADNALKAGQLLNGDTSTTANKPDSLKMAGRGPLLSLLTPTIDQQGQGRGSAVIGTADKNKRDAILALLRREDIASKFPRELVFAWSKDGIPGKDGKNSNIYQLYALRKTAGKDGAALSGEVVTDAKANLDQQSGGMEVSLSMNNAGAAAWGQLTTRAAADNKREVAIVLDSAIVSAPSVNTPILEGRSSITGNYSVQEANDFASILQVGKLPAGTEIVQESTIGPTLGAENISKSLISLVVALLAIVAFMCLYYASGGVVAVIALLANLIFIVGALTSIHTVLTLPGIAGIVLTMGIAVDANVIVYERIREELQRGHTLAMAIKDGFLHSYNAIIDGNVTNIISALVLMYFGLGPVKGFAVVLFIGVLFTLFTSLLLSRLLIDWWVGRGNDIKFSNTWSENAFKNINIDWMAMRGKTYVISGLFIAAGIVAFFTRGFDLGVDFKGGYSFNVQFEKPVQGDQLRTTLDKVYGENTIVKAVSTANTYNITTAYLVKDASTEAQEKVTAKLYEGLKSIGVASGTLDDFKKTSGKVTHITSASKVGPMVADDITKSSIIANFLALALIFIYILVRFSRWQYSVGAVIALFHDVLFILACFTLFHGFLPFSLEVDQAIVAAVLTISAYSMNDTVIVYDRIREYTRTYSEKPMREVINAAINSTLSRTIITSLNVLLVVLILFIFGGSSIKGFAFALIVGIFIGTYSSIFIASPVMLDLSKNLNLGSDKKPVAAAKEEAAGAKKTKKALKV